MDAAELSRRKLVKQMVDGVCAGKKNVSVWKDRKHQMNNICALFQGVRDAGNALMAVANPDPKLCEGALAKLVLEGAD